MNSVPRVAGRTLVWVGAAGAAGAAIVATNFAVGPIMFSAFAPLSGYGNSASPLFTMETFDLVVAMASGFASSVAFIGACLLVKLPMHRILAAVAPGFAAFVLWTIGVYGFEVALLGGAVGVALGCVSAAGVQRLIARHPSGLNTVGVSSSCNRPSGRLSCYRTKNGGVIVGAQRIVITQYDLDRLRRLVNDAMATGTRDDLGGLEGELDRAVVVTPDEVPADVVTMNSKVRLVDVQTSDVMEISLVFPEDADAASGAVSILAPVGTAIIGFSEGDSVEWPTPSGLRTFKIDAVLFQPEAAGEWDL